MEKTVRKIKPLYLIITIILLVAAVAAGIYFMISGGKNDKHSRGTYVISTEDFMIKEDSKII